MWTEEEIKKYEPIDNFPLLFMYEEKGLRNPDERARYLAEDVLNLCMIDHEVLIRIAVKNGRPYALNMLEEMAIHQS